MIARLIGLTIALLSTGLLFYASRFWEFRLWRGPLLDIPTLRPQGDLVAVWTRGTALSPFSLILWFLGAILLLTLLQWIWNALTPPKD